MHIIIITFFYLLHRLCSTCRSQDLKQRFLVSFSHRLGYRIDDYINTGHDIFDGKDQLKSNYHFLEEATDSFEQKHFLAKKIYFA